MDLGQTTASLFDVNRDSKPVGTIVMSEGILLVVSSNVGRCIAANNLGMDDVAVA